MKTIKEDIQNGINNSRINIDYIRSILNVEEQVEGESKDSSFYSRKIHDVL